MNPLRQFTRADLQEVDAPRYAFCSRCCTRLFGRVWQAKVRGGMKLFCFQCAPVAKPPES